MASTGTIQNNNSFNTQATSTDMSLVGATERGTRIVKQGADMDKNAFLKILAAELKNQDPTQAKDSTAYISQLAQFSSLEQMTNLNSTMSFNAASNFVGKNVSLKIAGNNGQPLQGFVKNAGRNGDAITLNVLTADGLVTAKLSDVTAVKEDSKMDMASAASLMGKKVKVASNDSSGNIYQGTITAVNKYSDGMTVKLAVDQVSVNKYMAVTQGKIDEEPPVLEGSYKGTLNNVLQIQYNMASDSYQYKYKNDLSWTKLRNDGIVDGSADGTLDGIKINLPKQKPSADTIFEATLPAQKTQAIELPADGIVEIQG